MTIRLYTPLAHNFSDIAEVVHIFYPQAQVMQAPCDACDILHRYDEQPDWVRHTFTWGDDHFTWSARINGDHWEQKRRKKRALKQCCYYLLKKRTGASPPWGSLTGIRPTRLFYERLALGDTPGQARQMLVALYDLHEDRARLLSETVHTQQGLIDAPQNAVDIYVGIPFCTTRCTYCSFFSEAVGNGKKVPGYLDALLRELTATAEIVQARRLAPRALYIGGGTPTALSPRQLQQLVQALRTQYPQVDEFTVEAGRPDTITPEKLMILRDAGVTRISINPQTMHDGTLQSIGRAHTARDTEDAFTLARRMGFDNINMDIIAGLVGEDCGHFKHTLRGIMALAPDSLTVHTLARKHGSRLNEIGYMPTPGATVAEMVGMGRTCATALGMRPYYLYRQKYVAGNLENVGYALPSKESLYNIDIMEETTSVLAVGAGAISKRIFHGASRIERAPNVGDVGHYVTRVDQMIDRKRALWELPPTAQ